MASSLADLETWVRSLDQGSTVAVVLGGQANGLSFLRSLARRGVPTVMFAGSDPGSRYGRTVELPSAVRNPEAWTAALDRVAELAPRPPVLLPTSDPLVVLTARYQAEAGPRVRTLMPPPEVVDAIIDKRAQYEQAMKADVPIPRTCFPSSSDELRELAPTLPYPALLKPYRSHLGKAALGAKALVMQNAEQLVAAYPRYAEAGHELMVQELIPGGEDTLFGYVALWDAKGREHWWFTRRKLRQFPPGVGNGSLQTSVVDEDVLALGRRLIESFDYAGPVAVEFKRDPRDGGLRLIEINARTGASNQMTIDSGLDFPWLIYQLALHDDPDDVPRGSFRPGVKWLYEELDFRAFRQLRAQGELTAWSWLRSLKGTKSWAYWSPRDPGPLVRRLRAYGRANGTRPRSTAPDDA